VGGGGGKGGEEGGGVGIYIKPIPTHRAHGVFIKGS